MRVSDSPSRRLPAAPGWHSARLRASSSRAASAARAAGGVDVEAADKVAADGVEEKSSVSESPQL